jgi:RimJ/RimL family protein N-acetyltransferase
MALPGTRRVEIGCDLTNIVSAAIPQRLGFNLDRVEVRPPTAPGESSQRTVWALEQIPSDE